MPDKVADASVIAAMAFHEDHWEEALELVRGCVLYEPPLLSYELTSVARKKAFQAPERSDSISAALDAALRLAVNWVEVDHAATLQACTFHGAHYVRCELSADCAGSRIAAGDL